MTPPAVGGGAGPDHEPASFEPAQDPAQVPGVEAQIAPQLGGGRPIAMRQLVQHADLRERERAAIRASPQHADLSRVEPIEPADRPHAPVQSPRRHSANVRHILDSVKYFIPPPLRLDFASLMADTPTRPPKKTITTGAWQEARSLVYAHRHRLALGLVLLLLNRLAGLVLPSSS